ncbi:MAG: hypothetical protein V4583_16285 [Pseudomonadota bacterium]
MFGRSAILWFLLRRAMAAGLPQLEALIKAQKPEWKAWVFEQVPGSFLDETVWMAIEGTMEFLLAQAKALLEGEAIFASDAEAEQSQLAAVHVAQKQAEGCSAVEA